ncbi:MAG TPA: ATP-binding cassette domain-containing protein, partial [Candidatus Acidoferrum sp.]|nr:ATP-binding cassette domain-containing protein [Candidatus Acidoferrum sp.]
MTLDRPLLSARLSVAYPNKADVLKNLSLDVQKGEIVGLVGESGSGKSTLAMAILRLLDRKNAKVTGEVLLDGE